MAKRFRYNPETNIFEPIVTFRDRYGSLIGGYLCLGLMVILFSFGYVAVVGIFAYYFRAMLMPLVQYSFMPSWLSFVLTKSLFFPVLGAKFCCGYLKFRYTGRGPRS